MRVLNSETEIPERPHDTRFKDANGYVWLIWNGCGQAREHRVVMRAPSHLHVHHVNGVRDDNRLENLELIEPGEHMRMHHRLWRGSYRTLEEKRCVICDCAFHPRNSQSTTCRSAECVAEHHRRAGKNSWKNRTRMTPEQRKEAARESRRKYKERQRALRVSRLQDDVPSAQPGQGLRDAT